MENTLIRLFNQEKARQIRKSIFFALLLSISVLTTSYFAVMLMDNDLDADIDTVPDQNNYVLSLSSYVDQQYTSGNVVAFRIHGNATGSIHPALISSELSPSESGWDVVASIVEGDFDDVNQIFFSFTLGQMEEIQQSFLESLDQTTEVEQPDLSGDLPSAQSALSYTVLYNDGTGFEFLWLGFNNLNILAVQNVTWSTSGASTMTTSIPQINQVEDSYQIFSHSSTVKYIAPLSAFDSFIQKLQELYTSKLEG